MRLKKEYNLLPYLKKTLNISRYPHFLGNHLLTFIKFIVNI